MEKKIERACIEAVYEKLKADKTLKVIESEAPDCLVQRDEETVFGVEVTEIYPNEGAARIVKIKGYSTELLSKKPYRHKDDRKYLALQKIRMEGKDGGDKREFEGLVQQLPSFRQRVALLQATIGAKEQKFAAYRRQAPEVDLVVYDPTSLFSFSDFPKFFPALAHIIGKTGIVNSRFREVFMLIKRINGKTLRLPLKLNIVAEEVVAFQGLIARSKFAKSRRRRAILYLVAALNLAGFGSMRASIENRTFCLHCGPWTLRYERRGMNIGNTLLSKTPEAGEALGEAVSLRETLSADERKFIQRLVKRREKIAGCVPLIFEVSLKR